MKSMSKIVLFRKGETLGTSTKATCPDLGPLVGLDGDLNEGEELVQGAGKRMGAGWNLRQGGRSKGRRH